MGRDRNQPMLGDIQAFDGTGWRPTSLAAAFALLPSVSFVDSILSIVDDVDATKALKFQIGTQATGLTTTIDVGVQTGSYSATLPVMPSSSIFAMSASALTSGRVPFATTNGLLLDSANLTFDGTNFAHGGTGTFATGTGTVTMNGSVTIVSGKILTLSDTTDATSISTGASKNAGGASVTKALWVGGLVNIAGALTLSLNLTSSSPTTGTLIISGSGGAGIGGPLWVGGLGNIAGALTVAGVVNVNNNEIRQNSTAPQWYINETDASLDNKKWYMVANAEVWKFRLINDAENVVTDIFSITRSGTTVGTITFGGATTQATNWAQTGATTHSTGTGAVSLNGDTTIASGKVLQLGNAYVATPQVTTGYVTLKDSTGTTYKVPCNV